MGKNKNCILEKLFADAGIDWKYTFYSDPARGGEHPCPETNHVEFENTSPLGEDIVIDVSFDPEDPAVSLLESLRDYYQAFDPEEHVREWIENRSVKGVPDSIRELLDDADAIDGMIKELIFALEQG